MELKSVVTSPASKGIDKANSLYIQKQIRNWDGPEIASGRPAILHRRRRLEICSSRLKYYRLNSDKSVVNLNQHWIFGIKT